MDFSTLPLVIVVSALLVIHHFRPFKIKGKKIIKVKQGFSFHFF